MRLLPLALFFLPATAMADVQVFESGPKQAQLVELFTSQGCSSCPPAERWLNALTHDPKLWDEIVPVAFHVDYWDRLGWPDPYANSLFSKRQRSYQRSGNVHSVYTPGFVVNGNEWRGYFRGKELAPADAALGDLQVRISSEHINVEFSTERPEWMLPAELNLAILGHGIVTEVKAGENARRKLPQDFVVLWHRAQQSPKGSWQLKRPEIENQSASRYAIAAWVSHPVTRQVMQATGGWLEQD